MEALFRHDGTMVLHSSMKIEMLDLYILSSFLSSFFLGGRGRYILSGGGGFSQLET